MVRLAALGLILLAACTSASPPTATVSAQPSPLRTASPSPGGKPVASPIPVIDLPISTVDLSCRLPVTFRTAGGDYVRYQGGFITFPQGTFQADNAGVISSGYVTADFFNTANPNLRGNPQTGPPFYDLAMKRWVPAGAGQASPDGASYAYALLTGNPPGTPYQIHVVNVPQASEKTFTVPLTPAFGDGMAAFVADFDGTSVYFSSQQPMGPPQGVWRLDVASGAVTELSRVIGVAAVRGGYAWVNRIDPRDPQGPQTGRSGPRSNSVVRVDLATGQETVWYYAAGNLVQFAGLDRDGDPIISVAFPTRAFADPLLTLVFSPNGDVLTVYSGGRGLPFSGLQPDRLGRLWLGSDRGIYLFAPVTGLRKVFAFGGNATGAEETVLPAGFCT